MKKISAGLRIIKDIFLNFFSDEKLVLISEGSAWSIYEDCLEIQRNLRDRIKIRIATTAIGLRKKIVHFASVNSLVRKKSIRRLSTTNRVILTWFHINELDTDQVQHIPKLNTITSSVHTSCTITKQQLISHGLNEEKITIIPIGVDTTVFRPVSMDQRSVLRKELHIPPGAVVIGSFQKDGNGWGEGLIPKLIKGPDIFCDAVEILAKQHPVHVLLTGPARGYVKKRLASAGIPYTHILLSYSKQVAKYYQVLDLYLVTSRAEGGPKALLESSASGIPFVTTKVGMAADILRDGIDCFIVPIGDVNAIVAKANVLINNPDIREKMVANAFENAQQYDIRKTIQQYYEKIYQHLLLK